MCHYFQTYCTTKMIENKIRFLSLFINHHQDGYHLYIIYLRDLEIKYLNIVGDNRKSS